MAKKYMEGVNTNSINKNEEEKFPLQVNRAIEIISDLVSKGKNSKGEEVIGISVLDATDDYGSLSGKFVFAMKTLTEYFGKINNLDFSNKESFNKGIELLLKNPPIGQEELAEAIKNGLVAKGFFNMMD